MADVSAREEVRDFWDEHVHRWLSGDDPMDEPLPAWFNSYAGSGQGAVTRDGFVEPYQGDLVGDLVEPRVVVLGLNPGHYIPHLQARDGTFATELRTHGSYSSWIRTHPYDRDPWLTHHGKNRYYTNRLAFTRSWLEDPAADYNSILIFELYPWHSTQVTAPMQPPAAIVDRFVWRPLAEIDVQFVFAFGAPWAHLATKLGLPQVNALGHGGRHYGSRVLGRAVRVYELPSMQQLVVEWHPGSAGPPARDETLLLREELKR